MATLSQLQLPPPRNWQDFESLCCDLWRAVWKDPNATKHGRQGQAQHGVDVFGNPNQQSAWSGVQCKGKDNYTNKVLTKDELRAEAEKATSFTPSLSHFTLATTGPRDATIQQVARTFSDENKGAGSFGISVWSWEDIVECLEQYPEVVARHFPEFAATTTMRDGFDKLLDVQHESQRQQRQFTEDIKFHVTETVSRLEPTPTNEPDKEADLRARLRRAFLFFSGHFFGLGTRGVSLKNTSGIAVKVRSVVLLAKTAHGNPVTLQFSPDASRSPKGTEIDSRGWVSLPIETEAFWLAPIGDFFQVFGPFVVCGSKVTVEYESPENKTQLIDIEVDEQNGHVLRDLFQPLYGEFLDTQSKQFGHSIATEPPILSFVNTEIGGGNGNSGPGGDVSIQGANAGDVSIVGGSIKGGDGGTNGGKGGDVVISGGNG